MNSAKETRRFPLKSLSKETLSLMKEMNRQGVRIKTINGITVSKTMTIYCCGCGKDVEARLTNGEEIYNHRKDLYSLPFWKCDDCGNFVGCHHKTDNRINPLGHIPTPELRNARKHIHSLLDPMWKLEGFKRKDLYKIISDKIGWTYHTAKIRNIEDAREVYKVIRAIKTKAGVWRKC